VADLLAGITGERPSAKTVTEIHNRSGGNPFFVEELLAASREDTAMPTALRDVVLARVEALSEPVQQVLQVAAVAGRRVDHEVLAAVWAQPVAQLVTSAPVSPSSSPARARADGSVVADDLTGGSPRLDWP
jgi:predicted ATPase